MSKKEIPDYIRKQRNDWGNISPVTKVIPNKKKKLKKNIRSVNLMNGIDCKGREWEEIPIGRATDLYQVTIYGVNRCSERSEDAFCVAKSRLA